MQEDIKYNQVPNRQDVPFEMQMQIRIEQYKRAGLLIQVRAVSVILKITD